MSSSSGVLGEGAFTAEGCNVMLNGFGDAAAIERLRASIADEHGVKVGYHDADVGLPSRVEDLVRAAERQLGPIDILVNNAVVRHLHALKTGRVARFRDPDQCK